MRMNDDTRVNVVLSQLTLPVLLKPILLKVRA